VHANVWRPSGYYLSMVLTIMLILLMMQLTKLGFIVFEINLMSLKLLRTGKLWLRIRQERSGSALDQIMKVNTATMSLIIIV